MKSKQIGLDKINTEIGKLYLQTLEKNVKYEVGDQIFVIVKNIKDKDFIFVESDIGSGILPKEQFLDEEGNITVNIGETISVFYIGNKNGENYFTSIPIPPYEKQILETAKNNKIPLKGKIETILDSGYYVKIGEILAFCPKSKLKKEISKGEFLNFIVLEINKNQIIVSYNDYIQIQKNEFKKNLIQSLKVGSVISGKINSINNHGILIELGYGFEAFVPNSEISYLKIDNISELYKIGQEIRVKIIKLNWKEDKIIGSIKELEQNPWLGALPFQKGDIIDVSIINIKNNGLLVKLPEGFVGFIPVKEINVKQKQIQKEFSINQKIKAMITQIDKENQKIFLSIKKVLDFYDQIEYQKYLENQKEEEDTIGKILFKNSK